jgi:hypothetical protein
LDHRIINIQCEWHTIINCHRHQTCRTLALGLDTPYKTVYSVWWSLVKTHTCRWRDGSVMQVTWRFTFKVWRFHFTVIEIIEAWKGTV